MSRRPPDEAAIQLRRDILLTAQVALLGEISPAIRAVTMGWDEREIRLRAIVDGEPSEADVGSMESVGSEIVASFPEHRIAVEVIRVDAPAPITPHELDAWVYARKERRE